MTIGRVSTAAWFLGRFVMKAVAFLMFAAVIFLLREIVYEAFDPDRQPRYNRAASVLPGFLLPAPLPASMNNVARLL